MYVCMYVYMYICMCTFSEENNNNNNNLEYFEDIETQIYNLQNKLAHEIESIVYSFFDKYR